MEDQRSSMEYNHKARSRKFPVENSPLNYGTDNSANSNLRGNMAENVYSPHQTKHRHSKMQNVGGIDPNWQQHSQVYDIFRGDNDDSQSLQSLNFEDLKMTRQFLSTIRIRHKNRRSETNSKTYKHPSSTGDHSSEVGNDSDEEYGLPSMRHRIKGLTERLLVARQQQSTSEVANHYRKAVLSVPGRSLQFYSSGVIKRFKYVSDTASNIIYRVNFWSQQFKEIEGHFGIATTTYFRFTRWLVKINFMVFFLFLCFIYIPQWAAQRLFPSGNRINVCEQMNGTHFDKMLCCSLTYTKSISSHGQGWETFLEIAQGTGILEKTMLFYGFYYSNLTYLTPGETPDTVTWSETKYNMGLAYLLVVGFSFLVVFIMIVKNSSRTIKETVMDFDNKVFPLYTNAVYSGWDYCINSENMASIKHKIFYNEIKANLDEVELKRQREKRTSKDKAKLYLKRILINVVVIVLLGGSFYAIYVATEYLLEKEKENLNGVLQLLISYLPSMVISALNIIVPEIFLALSNVEEYSQSFATHITIVRAVFLRLASVWVLIVSLYYRLLDETNKVPFVCSEERNPNATSCCGNTLWALGKEPVKCWENYVGKEFYKLGIFDFISVTLVIIFIKIPRSIIYQHLQNKVSIIAKIGKAKFDLPLEVLDVVYSQTVCWMGMFFTPLLPAITFVKVLCFFFIKKFELKVTESPRKSYRASRSYSFFQTVLLVSFIVISCLLGYMIGKLAIYYYWAVAVGYKKMEDLLKQQLKSEAHDKQYLLARVDEIIKKGQLNPDDY
ncbi:hypothetical protein BsWGS_05610 [Bradybaena similaris]